MKKMLLTIMLLLLLPSSTIYAQQSVSDIIGDNEEETTTITEEILEEEGDIKLKVPTQTDNPSYVISFIDPSEEEDGIQLEIDSDRFVEIESPYTLPALGIGDHTLKFQYTDNEGATQTLEQTIIILPRPPIFNSPVIDDTSITLTGTGLANAELLLSISTGTKTYQYDLDIPENGSWSYIFDEDISDEIYAVQGITRRYGYASDFSETLTFEVGDIAITPLREETPISFTFKQLNTEALKSLTSSNLDLLILSISIFVLGACLGVLTNTLIRGRAERKSLGNFREKINGEKKEEITLRELFEKDKGKEKGKEIKPKKEKKVEVKEKKEEIKDKKTKIVSKSDFLKVYKDFDPDTDKGKEKKKKFKISLTSRK